MTRERKNLGAALIMVLGVVSVIGSVSLISFETVSDLIRRSTKSHSQAQALEYARAGEFYGLGQAQFLAGKATNYNHLLTINGNTISQNLGDGKIAGAVFDATNCFNLNLLVAFKDGALVARASEVRRLARYFQYFGLGEEAAFAIAALAADWQDTDDESLLGGFESDIFGSGEVPFRAPNYFMSSKRELLLIPDVSPAFMKAVGPSLCIDPISTKHALNANALAIEHLPLLHTFLGPGFSDEDLIIMIEDQPKFGYGKIGEFFKQEVFSNVDLSNEAKSMFGVQAQRIRLEVSVEYGGVRALLTSVFHFDKNGVETLIYREFRT